MKRLLLWVGLAGALGGCNYDAALETYCRDTHLCKQVEGGWCSGPGAPCLSGCCGRLVCGADGMCGSGQRSALSITPEQHDFGEYSPGNPAPPPEQEFVVTNTGQVPTVALTAGLSMSTAHFEVDGVGCEGKTLAPGESCTVRARFTPRSVSQSYGIRLEAKEAQDLEEWKVQAVAYLQGSAGVGLEVRKAGDGTGSIVSTPAGIDCGNDCYERVVSHLPLVLEARYGPGTSLAGWTGCGATEGDRCTVDVNQAKLVTAEFKAWLQVEVRLEGEAKGGVESTGPGIRCNSDSYSYDCAEATGAPTVLVAKPSAGTAFVRWEGDCTGEQLECHLPMTGPTRVIAHFSPYNRVFLVDGVPLDALEQDLSGADLLCARYAPASAPNDYKAWLSVEGRPAQERLGDARGWIRAGDSVPVADTVADLAAGRLLSSPGTQTYLTATGAGASAAAERCADWSASSGTYAPGTASASAHTWQRDEAQPARSCSALASIYCFGTRYRTPMRLPSGPSRLAFLSSPWVPSGGLAGADAHCQADAAAAAHAGSFKAYLAPQGGHLDARFVRGLRYVRVDGSGVVGGDVYGLGQLRAPLNVTADGVHVGSTGRPADQTLVWTGGDRIFARAEDTCDGWQGSSGSAAVGRPEFVSGAFVASGLTAPCTSAQRLYCLQD